MKQLNQKSRGLILAIVALVLVAVVAAPAAAQDTPVVPGPQVPFANTITVSGFGDAFGRPDIARIEMGVDIANENVGEAFSQANTVMNEVIAAIVATGTAQEDVQTSGINMWAEDRYNPETGEPTGVRLYHVSNTVRVTVRDVEQVEEVISAAVEAGANNVYGLSFGIDDTDSLEQEARVEALDNARTRAEQLATAIGATLGAPIIVNETYGGGGIAMPYSLDRAQGGGGGAPVEPGQSSVSVQVQVTYSIG